jgi:integral membrane sensor domain MASE1
LRKASSLRGLPRSEVRVFVATAKRRAYLGKVKTVIVVAVAYLALGAFAAFFAYSKQDAWGVWPASGFALGLLFVRARSNWMPVLAGAFLGALIFEPLVGSSLLDSLGYAVIEVVVTFAGGAVASQLSPPPLRFVSPRDVGAAVAGAFVLALTGAVIVGLWGNLAGSSDPWRTFRVWLIGNFVGMLLVAPFVASWAQFRLKRSGGLTMSSFAGGAVACALFLICLYLLFSAHPESRFLHSFALGLTYLPFVFFVLVALLWGARGATLAALIGALIAIAQTMRGLGPFIDRDGLFGDAELNAQGYAVALAMTGLLVATLVEGQRVAASRAREWKTRFEAAIGAHGMIAYDWAPESGALVVSGDTTKLIGVPAQKVATLADWLACVAPQDRDAVAARFGERGTGGAADTMRYAVSGPSGTSTVIDEACAIRDHDGELHRIVGIVRVTPVPA